MHSVESMRPIRLYKIRTCELNIDSNFMSFAHFHHNVEMDHPNDWLFVLNILTVAQCMIMHFLRNFRCLHRITELICRNPELVIFFDMYDLLEQHGISTTQVAFSSDQNEVNSLEKCSVGVQTDVHPIPYSKCTDHTWNVWDLRRMAIKLADIQKCKTKSTQTFCHSSFGTQTHF